jgi:PHD-finger
VHDSADKSIKVSDRQDDDAKKSKASKFCKKGKSKQKQRQPTTEGDEFPTTADNNDDDCSAAKCLKPLGKYCISNYNIVACVFKYFSKFCALYIHTTLDAITAGNLNRNQLLRAYFEIELGRAASVHVTNSPRAVIFAGKEVDWVQCDACQLWFHLICVDLDKTDVSDDKEYICRTCPTLSNVWQILHVRRRLWPSPTEADGRKRPRVESSHRRRRRQRLG